MFTVVHLDVKGKFDEIFVFGFSEKVFGKFCVFDIVEVEKDIFTVTFINKEPEVFWVIEKF